MTSEELSYLDGWRQGTRTIFEFKRTREATTAYRNAVTRAKFASEDHIAWNLGRLDACRVALGEDL